MSASTSPAWNVNLATARDWIGSTNRLSWAMMLFGARQATRWAVQVPRGTAFAARLMNQTALRLGAPAVPAALPLLDDRAWRDFGNKLEAFGTFAAGMGAAARDGPSLVTAVCQCLSQDPYQALWQMESLGFRYAVESRPAASAASLLGATSVADLPRGGLVALHAGAGIVLAQGRLAALPSVAKDSELERALHEFLELCRFHGREGYTEVLFEALGLVVRNLHPLLLERVGGVLGHLESALADYLWHGAGRGLYFAPTRALPGSWRGALGEIRRRAPNGGARRNFLAGFVWALSLVNVRHPEVLASLLDHLEDPEGEDAWSHGVLGALSVWRTASGFDRTLERFLGFRPAGRRASKLWERGVRQPGRVLQELPERLDREGRPAALFRYQSLDALVRGGPAVALPRLLNRTLLARRATP